jgi:hypothetical protein
LIGEQTDEPVDHGGGIDELVEVASRQVARWPASSPRAVRCGLVWSTELEVGARRVRPAPDGGQLLRPVVRPAGPYLFEQGTPSIGMRYELPQIHVGPSRESLACVQGGSQFGG